MATQPKWHAFTAKWLAKKSPVVYLYGPTGSGKTHSLGTLIGHVLEDGVRPFAPVHYIDIDGGSETVGERAENKELCTLVPYDGRYGDELNWAFVQLEKAAKVECGAIILEGSSAIFDAMVTPEMRQILRNTKGEAWQAHNEPSRKINTLWQAVKELAVNRNHAGIGVPIFVSLNCRWVGDQDSRYPVPDFSVNVTRKCMRTADAFIELQRATSTKMLCIPDPSGNGYRKLRRPKVAIQVQKAWDLTLPGLLTLWAVEAAKARQKLSTDLKASLEAAEEATPEPQPEPDEKTTT